jgi:hypothetical protein
VAEYHAGSENNAIFDIPAQLVKTEIELGSG